MVSPLHECAIPDKIGLNLRCFTHLVALLIASAALAQQPSAPAAIDQAAPLLCTGAYSDKCGASAEDQKSAHKDFEAGLKLQREGHAEDAFTRFMQAADLVPRNVEYATAREILRQRLVLERIRSGDGALASHDDVAAMAAF